MVTGFDTRELCRKNLHTRTRWNWRIAAKNRHLRLRAQPAHPAPAAPLPADLLLANDRWCGRWRRISEFVVPTR
jgi:hypothetical protein